MHPLNILFNHLSSSYNIKKTNTKKGRKWCLTASSKKKYSCSLGFFFSCFVLFSQITNKRHDNCKETKTKKRANHHWEIAITEKNSCQPDNNRITKVLTTITTTTKYTSISNSVYSSKKYACTRVHVFV